MVNITATNYFENVTTLKGMLNIPNLTTSGFAWIGLLVMMEAIMVIAFLPRGIISAVFSSAFIILIAGIFLVYLELISWTWLMFFLAQILFLIIYVTWQERKR